MAKRAVDIAGRLSSIELQWRRVSKWPELPVSGSQSQIVFAKTAASRLPKRVSLRMHSLSLQPYLHPHQDRDSPLPPNIVDVVSTNGG